VTSVEQLSGDYCYFSPDYNLRSFRRSPKMIPFVDVETFGQPTKVSVEASAEQIVFTFTDGDGNAIRRVFAPSLFRAAWRENALVVRWSGVGPSVAAMIGLNVLGVVVQGLLGSHSPDLYLGTAGRESRLFRLEDGRLVMTDTFRESGDLRKPADQRPGYWERQDSVALLLDPVVGDCAAGPDHPPQPWYEKGVDLRNPDCAAQLEESIVSILVEKGESPEAVAAVARETVIGLRSDEKSCTNFRVAPASNVSYVFVVEWSGTGCRLRLDSRTKYGKHSRVTVGGLFLSGSGKRPLPACDCN